MKPGVNRRDFLKIGCGAAFTTLVACGGLSVLAVQTPEPSLVDIRAERVGPGKKILVAYATRAGSTIKVAETIGQALSASGTAVDVHPVKAVTDVKGYDAVVVGSAIRMGQWLPEAVEFVKTNQSSLGRISMAYFLVCAFMREDTPEARQKVTAYLDPVRQIIEPKSIGLWAGYMDYGKLSLLDRFIVTNVAKVPEGDWRRPDAIGGWARDLRTILLPA